MTGSYIAARSTHDSIREDKIMKKTRIEYRQLRIIGCSEKALSFYSDSDPLDIYELDDGSYTVSGVIDINASNADDLRRILDDLAEDFGYGDEDEIDE